MSTPTFVVVKVTPEIAKTWLKENHSNRNLNLKLVSDYARQILSGEWKLNGEAVKLASDGTLLDGQHRLSAIVMAGVAVEMLVISNLDPALQETMDAGRKRTTADAFAISGESNSAVLASIARRVWMWDRGGLRFPSSPSPSTAELRHTLEQYPSLRRSAEIASRTYLHFRPTVQAVTGTTHHLFNQIDEGLTAEFFAQLASGAGLESGHPVLTLRNRITSDKMLHKKVPFHLGVALNIRAWNALREGRTLLKIQHTIEEPMIMPV